MGFFKKEKRADILPLSCNPELDYERIPGIDTYYNDLNEVFKNPRIKNIAITGQRGVGKSSLIKSFDARKRSVFRRNPKFLYVSLGQYSHDEPKDDCQDETKITTQTPAPVSTCKVTVGTQEVQLTLDTPESVKHLEKDQNQEQYESAAEQNAIERRILLQLCSKFSHEHFPAGGFRQIPKKPCIMATFGFVLFAMSILLLMLKGTLGDLLLPWKTMCGIIGWIVKWNDILETVLYVIIFVGCIFIFAKCYRWIRLRGAGATLAVKTDNVEWGVEERVAEDYLDQYTQELVYYLSQVGSKIDRTVVFEDMDRLGDKMCISIFTRLREINYILNAHLDTNKYIRFVFVIDDRLAKRLVFSKFFDYIMPVIPTLNNSSSAAIFSEKLKEVNLELARTMKLEDLRSKVGVMGAHVIVFLDKHPLLRESCCHFRSTCKSVKSWAIDTSDRVLKFLRSRQIIDDLRQSIGDLFEQVKSVCKAANEKYDSAAAAIKGWVQSHPKVLWIIRLLLWIVCLPINLIKCLGTTPATRYFHRWSTAKISEIGRWFGRKKAFLCYHESKMECDSCDKYSACSSACICEDNGRIIQIAAETLTDYRLMFTILNEYSLMVRMYHSNNRDDMSCKVSEHILAFQIYKHLWPEDYQKLLSDNPSESVLYTKSTANVRWSNKELLQKMLDGRMLSLDSLHYAGFSRDKIASIWKKRLEIESFENVIKDMDPNNSMHQGLVREHCRFTNGKQITNEELKKAICFVLRQSDFQPSANDWFFESRDGSECIGILADLEDAEMFGFVKQCITKKPWNIFEKCSNIGDQLVPSGKWTERMALVCAAGVHPDKRTVARTGKKVQLNPEDGRTISFDSFDQEIKKFGIKW